MSRATREKSPEIEEALNLGKKHRALLKEIHSLEDRLRHWQRQNREAQRRIPKLQDRLQRLHRQRDKLLATNPFT